MTNVSKAADERIGHDAYEQFELTESTRQTIDDDLRATGKKPGDRLFTDRSVISAIH